MADHETEKTHTYDCGGGGVTTAHDLMVITSVQGYCACGQWGMATDGGLDRLRELHAAHVSTPPAVGGESNG